MFELVHVTKNLLFPSGQEKNVNMTGVAAISLPLISSRAVPKRYEETRPVLIQGCAHSTIIGKSLPVCPSQLARAVLLSQLYKPNIAQTQVKDELKILCQPIIIIIEVYTTKIFSY